MSLVPKIKWNKKPTQVSSTMTRYTDRALFALGDAIQSTSQKSATWIVDAKIKANSLTSAKRALTNYKKLIKKDEESA